MLIIGCEGQADQETYVTMRYKTQVQKLTSHRHDTYVLFWFKDYYTTLHGIVFEGQLGVKPQCGLRNIYSFPGTLELTG